MAPDDEEGLKARLSGGRRGAAGQAAVAAAEIGRELLHEEAKAGGGGGRLGRCAPIPRAGAEDWARWASVRGSGTARWGERPRPGRSPGTVEALAAAQAQLIVCGAPRCSALVALQHARRVARAAGRAAIGPN